jgi:hypothetical protein
MIDNSTSPTAVCHTGVRSDFLAGLIGSAIHGANGKRGSAQSKHQNRNNRNNRFHRSAPKKFIVNP